jgi:hypothetical protein
MSSIVAPRSGLVRLVFAAAQRGFRSHSLPGKGA